MEEGREPDRLYVTTVGQLNGDYPDVKLAQSTGPSYNAKHFTLYMYMYIHVRGWNEEWENGADIHGLLCTMRGGV